MPCFALWALRAKSVDVIISNCVLNYSSDKPVACREMLRVLRPGGTVFVSGLVVEGEFPEHEFQEVGEAWREWLRVAVGKSAYVSAIRGVGFYDVLVLAESAYEGEAMEERLVGRIVSLHLRARKQ